MMKKTLFAAAFGAAAVFSALPAQANDANTVFNGISAASNLIGVFQRSNTNRHLNNIEQMQSQEQYRHYQKDQAAAAQARRRAAANQKAAAEKAAAQRQAAEKARVQAAAAKARAETVRQQQLDALKY